MNAIARTTFGLEAGTKKSSVVAAAGRRRMARRMFMGGGFRGYRNRTATTTATVPRSSHET